MTRAFVALSLVLVVAAPALAQGDRRGDFLAQPRYAATDVRPAFRELSAAEVERGVLVVSSRNYAAFGFNTPEVQLYLPDVDNSVYAEVDMPPPELDGGHDYELERGLFDAEKRMTEVRFLAADGSAPAELRRAVGTITVRYPLAVATHTVRAGEAGGAVTIDGPFVEVLEGATAKAPAFSPLEALRAYDSAGRRLEKASWSSHREEHGVSSDVLAFHGAVARVDFDRVSRWLDLAIAYDLPPVPPLPPTRAGLAPESDERPRPTPGGKVTVSRGEPYDAPVVTRPTPTRPAVPTRPPAPTPARRPVAAAARPPVPHGPPVTAAERSTLSAPARTFAASLDALLDAVPDPPAIVQLVAFASGVVSVSVSTASGAVEQYMIRGGKITGPTPVDTRWLDCTAGLAPGALDRDRLPALWDDAVTRLGKPDTAVYQLIVGQHPCGSAWINVSFAAAGSVKYDGRGRPLSGH